jgi:hypothetical protein
MPLPPHSREFFFALQWCRLLAFHGIQHFKREVVAARRELAYGRSNQVVSNNGRNCSRKPRGSCDQSL